MVKTHNPDILGLQELDHYRFMQNRLGLLGYTSVKDDTSEQDKWYMMSRDNCTVMTDGTFAFIPKIDSYAKRVHSKPWQTNDNDGSAVFWKKDRFKATLIKKFSYHTHNRSVEGAGGGAVAVLLEDTHARSPQLNRLWAMSTQLAYGSSMREEKHRIHQVRELGTFIKNLSAVNEGKVAMLMLMDGNTHPQFTSGTTTPASNMHRALEDLAGLHTFDLQVNDEGNFPPQKISVSVNKMRGTGTEMLDKIGKYDLNREDYVCFNNLLEQTSRPHLDRFDRALDMWGAYKKILPNAQHPSDHLPVVLNVGFKDRAAGCGLLLFPLVVLILIYNM